MHSRRPLVALLPIALAACSSGSSGSQNGPGLDGGTDSGGGDAFGGCSGSPSYVLPLTSFSPNGGTVLTITSDETILYLGAETGLFSLRVAGGSVTSIFGKLGTSTTSSTVQSFWFSGSNVLFINGQNYLSVPKTGGSPTTLASLPNAHGQAVTDGTTIYFVTNAFATGDGGVTMQYALSSIPVAGGTPKPILTFDGPPDQLILSGGSLYWIDAGNTLFGSGPLYTMPVTSSTPTKTGIQAMAGQLAADDTYLYYSSVGSAAPGPAMRVQKSDLTAVPMQVSNLGGQWLAVQGTELYGCVVDGGRYQAWKTPLTGGTATVLACAPSGTTAQGFGVDSNNVYMSVTQSSSRESGVVAVPR